MKQTKDEEPEEFTDYEEFYQCALAGGKDYDLVDENGYVIMEYVDKDRAIYDTATNIEVEEFSNTIKAIALIHATIDSLNKEDANKR
jgi:hypothetical protein